MRRYVALALALAIVLPTAAHSATYQTTTSSNQTGVTLKLVDAAGSIYREGESVRFLIETDYEAYVLVFNIDTHGFVHLLYPRLPNSIQQLSPGRTYDLPNWSDEAIVVNGPTGMEFAFAVAVRDEEDINDREIGYLLEGERLPVEDRFRVDGDPFLAANRIASQLIRDISHLDGVSMAYTYYYVNEAVDYPRYLCENCYEAGRDPYGSDMPRYVATDAFEASARLSYPLGTAFEEQAVVLADRGGERPSTVTHVYVTYPYWSYYYPAYYPYYYPSGFYFSVGWYWGWGWGYPAYRWHCYAYPYYYYPNWCYGYGSYPAYYSGTRGLRHNEIRTRYRSGTSSLHTAMNYRSQRANIQKSSSQRSRHLRGVDLASRGSRRSDVKIYRSRTTRQVSKIRPYRGLRDSYTRTYGHSRSGKSRGYSTKTSRPTHKVRPVRRVYRPGKSGSSRVTRPSNGDRRTKVIRGSRTTSKYSPRSTSRSYRSLWGTGKGRTAFKGTPGRSSSGRGTALRSRGAARSPRSTAGRRK